MKSVVIGCDNAAVSLKNTLKSYMESKGISVEDVGCGSADDPTNYPEIAGRACRMILAGGGAKEGVLVCGTGIGMCISANKFKGIRAAVCHDSYSAERAKLSNSANVVCFGERVIGAELAKKILGEWLNLAFIDGPSTPKVNEILKIEEENFK